MSENKVNVINEENFEKEVINNSKPALVDFWAPWCQPCQMMTPILETVAEELGDKIKIIKIDITENESLAEKFNILSIPTLIVFHKGEEKKRINGLQNAEQLKDSLREFLLV